MASRRLTAASFISCSTLILLLLPTICFANLMGVDLGLSYIKVAVARPGKGLELVTNEQAKRKTPAVVGFTDEGERLFGDAAIAYAAKAPNRVILDGRSLIGQCNNDEDSSPLCTRHRLNLEGVANFTGEEVIAMLLGMARRQASAFLGGSAIKDVAITVPSWFDERQRLAVSDAARVIGLNCLGVVNANTAAAIKYALDGKAKPSEEFIEAEKEKDKKKRAPKSVTQRILFYDVGASSTTASVIEITSDVKTGIASSIKVLSHVSELGLSGTLFDDIVIERLADAFDKQRGNDAKEKPTRDLPRVMARLRKEGRKAREVLSANTETFVSIGSLYDDLDLKTSLNRLDFENDASSILSLVGAPAKAAISSAGLTSKDLHAVVPFGGASRTPKIQEELCNALKISSLNKSINTDEAAVMGSVFFAASMSSTFRVRKMDIDDIYERGVSVEIERDGGSGGLFSGGSKKGFQTVEVFPEDGCKIPSKKTVSLNRDADFAMRIYLTADKTGKTRFPQRTLYATVNIKGIPDVLEKMKDKKKAKSSTPRVALSFHIDRSGLIRIGTAESSVDENIIVEREVEIKEDKKDKKDKKEDKKEDSKDSPNDESKDEPEKSGQKDETKDKKKEKKKEKKKTKIEKSSQTVVHRHTLTVEYVEGEGVLGLQMSGTELVSAQKVLKDLELADMERVERADAFNALEGFILEIRSQVRGVEEEEDLYKVTSEEARESLVSKFDEAEDWMYTDEAKDIGNLRKKHHEVQQIYAPMGNRVKELQGRHKLIKKFRKVLNESLERISVLRKVHETANSTHVKDFDKFPELCQQLMKWVDDKEIEQDSKPLTEDPVFTIADVKGKLKELAKEVTRIVKLDIPVLPKVVSGGTSDDDNKTDDSKSNATESDASTEEEESEDRNVPPNPEADTAQADSASGSSAKDEL